MSNKNFSSVEEMSAYLTHSINTPLTYIKGNLEIMDLDIKSMPSSELKNELLASTKKISKGIQEIQKVVNNVHAVTKDSPSKK